MDLWSSEECLVVNWNVVEWILCPSSPSPRLAGGEGITSLVNKSSKFIPGFHAICSCYILAGIVEIPLFGVSIVTFTLNTMLISLGYYLSLFNIGTTSAEQEV